MLETLLFASSVILGPLCIYLYIRLQKERCLKKSSPSSPFEDIFNTLAPPIFYKKGSTYAANKTFHRAFGSFAKEAFERLDTLPKYGQHTLELTFDNGVSKSVLIYCSPLHAKDNTLLGHTGVLFDTSELNKNKENLLFQKERLEMAIESSGDGVWDWDMKNDTLFFSKTWKQIMGYDEDDRPNMLSSWLNLVHSKDMAMVNEQLKSHLDGKSEFFFVEHRLRDTNPLRWITVRGQAYFDKHHKPFRMSGTIRNITARKVSEEKERQQLALFVSFFEHLPAIAFIKNSAGEYLYINSFYQRYLGFKTWNRKTAHELFDTQTAEAILESDRLATYEGVTEHTIHLPREEGVLEAFKLFKFIIETDENEKLLCGFGVMINKSFR